METIPRIVTPPPGEERIKLRDIFFQIERKARLSGNAEVLIQLDRIPGLMLGAANRVSEGAEDAAMADAYTALTRILAELERPKRNPF